MTAHWMWAQIRTTDYRKHSHYYYELEEKRKILNKNFFSDFQKTSRKFQKTSVKKLFWKFSENSENSKNFFVGKTSPDANTTHMYVSFSVAEISTAKSSPLVSWHCGYVVNSLGWAAHPVRFDSANCRTFCVTIFRNIRIFPRNLGQKMTFTCSPRIEFWNFANQNYIHLLVYHASFIWKI